MARFNLADYEYKTVGSLGKIEPMSEATDSSELMTSDEHRAIQMTVDLWNLLVNNIVGDGLSRENDLAELASDIHRVQERLLAQAASRAYPHLYRGLGGTVKEREN
jgi:hypothetical protein